MSGPREEFLSEEDLDLANLSEEELFAWWDLWLRQAQASNELDEHLYSHGVFTHEPGHEPERDQAPRKPGGSTPS